MNFGVVLLLFLVTASLAQRVALVVRTHDNPSAARLERMKRWFAETETLVDFWVLEDFSRIRDSRRKTLNRIRQSIDEKINMFEFTWKRIGHEFPVLLELNTTMRGDLNYPYRFPQLSLLMWWEHFEMPPPYDFIWCFEDDVDFSGNLSGLIKAYESSGADYIAKAASKATEKWAWFDLVTEKYASWVRKTERLCNSEHVQRISRRLMELMRECVGKRIMAHGEQFLPSICNKVEWCRAEGLQARHIGEKYSWNKRVSRDEFDKFCRNNRTRNRLYHALKF